MTVISAISTYSIDGHRTKTYYMKYRLTEADKSIHERVRLLSHLTFSKGGKMSISYNSNYLNKRAQHCEDVDHKRVVRNKLFYSPLHSSKLITAAPIAKPMAALTPKPAVKPQTTVLVAKPAIAAAVKPIVKPIAAIPLALTPQQVTATIQGLQAQVNKLSADVALLNKQLAAEKVDKERIAKMLNTTQAQLATITAAMHILLGRN